VNLFAFNESEIMLFFASFVRVTALFMMLPLFGDNNVPVIVRIFLAFTVNLIVYPVAAASGSSQIAGMLNSDLGIVSLTVKEALVGGIIGFTAKLFFDALGFAFAYIGMQMGFGMASVYDHQTETSTPVVSQLIMILATLLFLGLDGHHLFLKALVQSYEIIPVGELVVTKAIATYMMETGSMVFWIAVKLSAPMALMIFLINCAFGVVSKAVPQINVLIVSFTVNILAGFLVIVLTLPVFGTSVGEVFQLMFDRMLNVMKILA
jgi:flagellar biosynthetic protein FliR